MKPVVAIAGATGHLGKHVASAFLSPPLCSHFSEIILLSRQDTLSPQVPDSRCEVKLTTRKYDENNLAAALEDVQILVNTVGASGHEFKEKLLRALPETEVEVYFPSEFGVDHYIHDFPHLEWDQKTKHFNLARQLTPKVKVCRVFSGLFLEDSIGPWFGFDTKNGKYESVGSPHTPISFTSLDDVGRSVAALCALPKEKIPDVAHLAGDTQSISEIAGIMKDAGAGQIDVTEISLQKYKDATTAQTSWYPASYLRFLMGENRINHTSTGLGNVNELVNADQKLWKWGSLADLANQERGTPWKDFPWPPK
ncbi:hypothetical protein EYZ11_003969 [Aspergillus tanneri]|uniref:NmrA-like domain-containing protein n=1 Tax=Aspergillus tanneri TaxID=1220188 RepID=A0A4S3JP56_9EURO|nr:uncharacterized protein ATNIH1004_010947 [Aspergillus tanneri]KAA8642008.1 hypothetical protein ATNIH1004_010947 [Aspergillus tanneri]THC96577.1 hypothetical protein EYZ11_003969 [Aspergillus tanneri]